MLSCFTQGSRSGSSSTEQGGELRRHLWSPALVHPDMAPPKEVSHQLNLDTLPSLHTQVHLT